MSQQTAIAVQPEEGTDLQKLYPPKDFTLLTSVAIYTNPPPYMQRKVLPVPITEDDYHAIETGKNAGQMMRAATWFAKVARAMGWEEDKQNSGLVKDWPTKRDPNDARYEMRGWLLLDEGRTYVQAGYTWDYQARMAVIGKDSARFKEELQWKDSKCETGALSRIIAKTLGIKRLCTKATAAKPVVLVRTEVDLRAMVDDPVIGPDVRKEVARRAFGATEQLFGGARVLSAEVIPEAPPLSLGDGCPDDEDDVPEGIDPETGEILDQDTPPAAAPERDADGLAPEDTEAPEEPEGDPFAGPYQCAACGTDVSFTVAMACLKEHEKEFGGKVYCVSCGKAIQAEAKKEQGAKS